MKRSKRTKIGRVISAKMNKTVVVEVNVVKKHPKYHKRYIRSKRFLAHCDGKECLVGDVVTIAETNPISKFKKWQVLPKTSAGRTK